MGPMMMHRVATADIEPVPRMRHGHDLTHGNVKRSAAKKRRPRAGTSRGEVQGASAKTMSGDGEGQQEFFFVDASSSKKGKRSHVMKHHVREKRKGSQGQLSISGEQHTRIQANRSLATGAPTSASTAKTNPARILLWLNEREEQGEGEARAVQQPGPTTSTLTLTATRDVSRAQRQQRGEQREQQREQLKVNLRDQPGEGTLDPFDTLPVPLTPEVQRITDMWTTKLAYWSGQNPYMKSAVFRCAMRDVVTFQIVVLTYAARFEATASGNKRTGTATSRAYVAYSRRLLEEGLQEERERKTVEGDCREDDGRLVMALASLSIQEGRYGDPEHSKPYMEMALSRLRQDGNKKRTAHRDWGTEGTFAQYLRLAISRLDGEAPRTLTAAEGERLIRFVHEAEAIRASGECYLAAFRFGSPLHFLLAGGPIPTHIPEHERQWVIESTSAVGSQCRTSALMYIVAALLDLRGDGARGRFISQLETKVAEQRLDREPSAETLLWILLEGSSWDEELRNNERTWFVGDLAVAARGLGEPLRFLFGEVLLRTLMGREADLEISTARFEREVRTCIITT